MRSTNIPGSLQFRFACLICRSAPPLIARRLRLFLYPFARARRENLELDVRAHTGSHLRVSTADHHGYRFALHGYFDWRNIALARALATAGDTVLEIGANIGTETISLADIVGPGGRVIAFEPLPYNLQSLHRMVADNGFAQIRIIAAAVTDKPGTLRFTDPGTQNSGVGHIVSDPAPSNPIPGQIQVESVSLDSLAAEIAPVTCIWMDAEGAEPLIVQGANELLARDRPVLVLEASPSLLGQSKIIELYADLVRLRYDMFQIRTLTLTPLEAATVGHITKSNWLCVPQEKRSFIKPAKRFLFWSGILPCLPFLNPLARPSPPRSPIREAATA